MAKRGYVTGIYNVASVQLLRHLRELGVIATVGYGRKSGSHQLFAYVANEEDKAKVPTEFKGFNVEPRLESELEP